MVWQCCSARLLLLDLNTVLNNKTDFIDQFSSFFNSFSSSFSAWSPANAHTSYIHPAAQSHVRSPLSVYLLFSYSTHRYEI